MIAFAPGMLATNLLFQPVALDQLATMVVLWLALRLALGRGSWALAGESPSGLGLETKYTLAVVLVLLVGGVPRRGAATLLDAPGASRSPRGVAAAAARAQPRLAGAATAGTSVRWFLDPPAERHRRVPRPQFVAEPDSCSRWSRPGHPSPPPESSSRLVRDRALRPLGAAGRSAPSPRTSSSAASRTTRCRSCSFALAVGAIPFDRWATRARLAMAGTAFATTGLLGAAVGPAPCCRYARPSGSGS